MSCFDKEFAEDRYWASAHGDGNGKKEICTNFRRSSMLQVVEPIFGPRAKCRMLEKSSHDRVFK